MATLRILRKLISLALLALSFQMVLAQAPIKLRSTLSIGGTSNTFTSLGKSYVVQQSIGQSSVIDSYHADGFTLRQGFIQPLKGAGKSSSKQTLQATVSPNPFSSSITISFTESISDNLSITLYDLYGRTLFSSSEKATPQLSFNFSSLASGLYVLSVDAGEKSLVVKLAKE